MRSKINLLNGISQKNNQLNRFSLRLEKIKDLVVEKIDKIILIGFNGKNISRKIGGRDLKFSILDEMKEINGEKLKDSKETEKENLDTKEEDKKNETKTKKEKNKGIINDIKSELYSNQELINNEFKKLTDFYRKKNFLNKQKIQNGIIDLKRELDNLEKNKPNNDEIIFYRIKQRGIKNRQTKLLKEINDIVLEIDKINKQINDLVDNFLNGEIDSFIQILKNEGEGLGDTPDNNRYIIERFIEIIENKRIDESKLKKDELKGKIDEFNKKIKDLGENINKKNQEKQQLEGEINNFELSRGVSNKKTEELEQNIKIKTQEKQKLELEIKNLELSVGEKLDKSNKKIVELEENIKTKNQKYQELEGENNNLEGLRKEYEENIQEKYILEGENNILRSLKQKKLNKFQKILNKSDKEIKEIIELEENINIKTLEIQKLDEKINSLDGSIKEYEEKNKEKYKLELEINSLESSIKELKQESEDEINQLKFNIKTKKHTVLEIETEINSLELLKKEEEEKIKEKDLNDKNNKLKLIDEEISKLENRKKRIDPKLKNKLEPIQKTYTILNIITNKSLDNNAKIINILQFLNNFNT